ncbi:flagellar type III secretion system pore protein FliP [Tepidibacter hydrothermalis]|uniref:Flagellar biosynthetic protein FliP n=1 Tax=Tepidibacter hydrothermalis TaxID=3036126 RepID=A0ABY8EHD8_9FIRM|nr:flagellar type III secretion system pore protein FliP [Tepidibacter hydrothermalis]WFD12341.1 flagellar type III secretion system pore protein FliP [Tepidibacter hydrothermalis]
MNGTTDPGNLSSTVEIILLFTVLSLLPTIIIMMTSFTRIIIVLSFLRNALATQQNPPTQVLIGLALFLTFFIMAPVGTEIYDNALNPYFNQQISQEEAFEKGMKPVRNFMFRQTRKKDILLFTEIAKIEKIDDLKLEDVPNRVLIPAFLISELKTGFQMGFVLFIPFIIVDMVVASTLMSMGMMMLPPVMISLPFKVLLFILVDGWNLVVKSIVLGFK